jgi:hypothetical protein
MITSTIFHGLSRLSVLDMYRTNLGALDQDLFVSQSESLMYLNLGDTVVPNFSYDKKVASFPR